MRPKPDINQARLLPHLRASALFTVEITSWSGFASKPEVVVANPAFAPDPQDLRGIPVIGRGVGGTSPGTQPENAAVRKLSR